MSVQVWTYIIVGLSFALYIGIAIWSRAKSTKDFYVAATSVPPIANGMATGADWMSAASFISMAGMIAFMGYSGAVYLMGWTGGYVLLAMLLAPYLRKFGKFTVPDFVGDRYYSKTARIIAVITAIFISFTYVAGQMRGVGIVFARFLEVDINLGVVIGMVIVFFYAVLGGMKGITWTQVAQYLVLIIAYLVPAIFLSLMMTGHILPQTGLGATLNDGSNTYLLDRLDGLTTELGFAAYTAGTTNMVDMLAITFALMVGTAGLPHVIVRFYTVPKVRDARTSAGWALFFIALLYTTAPAVGAFARTNLIQTVNNKPVTELPAWVFKWKETGLLKFEDKNGDGMVQYYNDKTKNEDVLKKAEEAGWKGNELTVDRDIMVLANPEIGGLPNWVVGLVAAGGLAAALSTAAGLLLVISTSVAHDLIKNVINPSITEKGELMAARIAAGGAVIIAGYFGINPPGFVAQVVAFAFGLAAASFFPLIIMGIFNKRMNKEGALSGLVVGLVFTAGYIIYFKFMVPADQNVAKNWLFGISPEGIGTIGALLNIIVAYTVSKFTPAPPQEVMDLVESIRYPRGAGAASVH
jgi:cation/acetate symporter